MDCPDFKILYINLNTFLAKIFLTLSKTQQKFPGPFRCVLPGYQKLKMIDRLVVTSEFR